uniref:LIM zinc-binding domain-containing protein n=1 Tax=Meloidogyne incognita TaxID=6306 RepID=A0A914M231_MELIC
MQGGGRKPAYHLRSGTTLLFDTRPYCLECQAKRSNPRCALETCQQLLAGEFFFALGSYWHPQCFRCEGCSRPLEGGNYYLVDNRPYDLACHWGRRLALQNGASSDSDLSE